MKRLRLVDEEAQERVKQRPTPGENLFLAIDLSRSKWVYALRWGDQLRRRWIDAKDRVVFCDRFEGGERCIIRQRQMLAPTRGDLRPCFQNRRSRRGGNFD